MAKLEEIAALMNVAIPCKNDIKMQKGIGRKRRSWLEDEQQHINPPSTLPPIQYQSESSLDVKQSRNWVHNQVQTGYKLGTEPGTNWVQNRVQTGYKENSENEINEETGYRTGYKLGTNWVQTGYRTGYKKETIICFSGISGIQRSLISLIYNECRKNCSTVTNPLSIEYLSDTINTSANTIKTTLKRLAKKNLILRDSYKEGRGGWTKYSLHHSLYQELLQHESTKLGTEPGTNWVQTGYKLGTEPGTEPGTSSSSSSSNIHIITTTTEEEPKQKSTSHIDELDKINIKPLTSIGFTKNHLLQLIKTNHHSVEIIQDAIYAFAHDLTTGATKPQNPLGMFISVMKNSLYLPASADYENPEIKAKRLYLERHNAIQEQNSRVEEELIKEHFLVWKKGLSEEDQNAILSEEAKQSAFSGFKTAELKSYHHEQVWPMLRDDFYQERGLTP